MSGINAIFNTASTSIVAQRVAMEVTGENITNANTPGYSRQRAIMETAPVTATNGFPMGNGVLVKSVQRYYDAVLQKNITDGNSLLQNNQNRLTSLQEIEPAFNEMATSGLGKSIQDFFDSWQTLSNNAAGTAERQTVLTRAQVMVENFHQANQNLRNVQITANRNLEGITADISQKAKSIASLNAQIVQTELGGASSSELRDKRDYLAQELAKKMGATFTEEKDGSMTVSLPNGSSLVERNQYATLYTSPMPLVPPNANNVNPSNHILITNVGDPPLSAKPISDTDITTTVGGPNNTLGEIGAMLGLRDTVVPAYLQKLDELAYNLAYQVNAQHKQGWNLNGNTNTNFFAPATLTAPPASAVAVAGYSSSNSTLGIKLNISSTNEIAAADVNPVTGGVITGGGNNTNALALAAIKDRQVSFATSGGASASVISYYNAMVSGIGVDVQAAQNATNQGESYVTQLNNLRESNSGVSLDEEMTNMIKYQKAFQGAARLITTATDMMDTVLAMVR